MWKEVGIKDLPFSSPWQRLVGAGTWSSLLTPRGVKGEAWRGLAAAGGKWGCTGPDECLDAALPPSTLKPRPHPRQETSGPPFSFRSARLETCVWSHVPSSGTVCSMALGMWASVTWDLGWRGSLQNPAPQRGPAAEAVCSIPAPPPHEARGTRTHHRRAAWQNGGAVLTL